MFNFIPVEDINYLAQQSTSQLNIIISEMTALVQSSGVKMNQLESQKWYQRMVKTVFGKNKLTKLEIEKNHDKLTAYLAEALSALYNRQCFDEKIIQSLVICLNVITAEHDAQHDQLKQILGSFVAKLNAKIESIDNYQMLNTEIEQGVYSDCSSIVSICEILSQMDKRCVQDNRKVNILKRSMKTQNLLSEEKITLGDLLLSITDIPIEEAGHIYLELNSIRSDFAANMFLKVMEQYHFLSDMERRAKNKTALIQSIIDAEQIEPSMLLSIAEVFENFVKRKAKMYEEISYVSSMQNDSKLEEAERLFFDYQLDEAFELFMNLAEHNNGRAMYFLGLYYANAYGKISEDIDEAKKWWAAGRNAGDVLAALCIEKRQIIESGQPAEFTESLLSEIKCYAEKGDIFSQYEWALLYYTGRGVNKDLDEAKHWFLKGAQQGFWRAQNALGMVWYYKSNYEKAMCWFCRAADKGYEQAQSNIEKLRDRENYIARSRIPSRNDYVHLLYK